MNPILAQLSQPNDHELVIWLAIAGIVIFAAWTLVQIFMAFRRQPPIEAQFVSREEWREENERNEKQHAELYTLTRNLGNSVATMEATVELNGQRLVQMDQKLDRLLERKS